MGLLVISSCQKEEALQPLDAETNPTSNLTDPNGGTGGSGGNGGGNGGGTGGSGGGPNLQLTDTMIQNRVAVLEDFTGVKCQFCPDGARMADGIEQQLGNKFITIATHGGGYATPTGGVLYPNGMGGNDTLFYADFRSGFDLDLIDQSGANSYPSGTMNRMHVQNDFNLTANVSPPMAMSRSHWATTAGVVNSLVSPVNVGASATVSGRNLTVEVELYYTDEETVDNFIHVGILQDGIKSLQVNWTAQAGGFYDSAYVQNNVLRTYITGQWGERITETTTKGTVVKRQYQYNIPDKFVEHPNHRRGEGVAVIDDLKVVVFVSHDRIEILNATEVDVQ